MSTPLRKTACLIIILSTIINISFSHDFLIPVEKPILSAEISSEEYIEIITNLSDHINGVIVLTDSDFINNHDLLVQNMSALTTDMESITKSFELLDLFEETYGALFNQNPSHVAPSTTGGHTSSSDSR